MARTLLLGARVLDPGGPDGLTALEITGDRITWVGTADDAAQREPGAVVVDLAGAVVTPAFVDAHVHATAAGLVLSGLDLTGCPSPADLLDAVASCPDPVVWGHGWQEVDWDAPPPTRAELDRAARGRPVYLTRVDMHSALVSSALLDRAPAAVGSPGWSDGPLTTEAHHHVRRAALAGLDTDTRRRAQQAFLDDAARRGVAVVHECAGPDISGRDDVALLRTLPGPEVVAYWGEAVRTPEEARDLVRATGAHGLAGDVFVDGSLGSRTAALRSPYTDAPGCTGTRFLDACAISDHVTACTAAGIQAGFHVIGDAAADMLLTGLRTAHRRSPRWGVTHRVEHLGMVDDDQARTLAELGVVACVQPLFDAYWGGPDGMYAARLGPHRAARVNPFARLRAAGVPLAFGSDCPVTPVNPWAALRAAVHHRTPGSGLRPQDAFAAHTVGGHRAAGDADPRAGRLLPGAPASYALWDGAGVLDDDPRDPCCLRTVHAGRILYDALGAG